MRIGQAIDMIVMDKNKEFESGKQILYFNKIFNQIFIRDEINKRKYPLEPAYYHNDWKLMEKPVSFMEAVKSGRDFKLDNPNDVDGIFTNYMDLGLFIKKLDNFGNEGLTRALLSEGEFYIEEEDHERN